ncbi:hypothetical protein OS175_00195 [Marinicella sp. S1101]|uniref:hypothetical protein n=1 Tax=Marinicella marina TaxID=2996016 RepID=UPI002260DE2A|nr:hypothetical protein [Marinicella marina]MCX7552281.1 hypothetical protein [Marinicella marina]MDJ1139157.1 hypothetical protein [Marinicella marina]
MKKFNLKKSITAALVITGLSASLAHAVPWCHQGTIVQIADVNWGESSIIANYPGSIPADIPPWVTGNVDMHITFMATHTYASGFAGGGGGFGGYSVPGSGQVKVYAYAPYNYITAPSLYSTAQGVQFKLKKCYTIPPMVAVKELRELELPWSPGGQDNPVSVRPLERLQELDAYWEKTSPRR